MTDKSELRVAVVGGGPGGLFATYILNQRAPKARVVLFEASDALGGKLSTDAFEDGTPFEAGVAELYEYLGPGGKDPLRQLIEEDLKLRTVEMSGGAVVLGEHLLRDLDEVEQTFSRDTRQRIERFHRRMTDLMPLEKFAHRWQPENDHPWAAKDFRACLREEIPDDPDAVRYIETAVHSDLATEPHTCNGLNAVKNVLLDNPDYMQLYHVLGGIGRIAEELEKKIEADVRLEMPVTGITKKDADRYTVHYRDDGEPAEEDFDAVVVALPNHWLTQLRWSDPALGEAIHSILAHYDLPAHYLRVTLLFKEKWWEHLRIPGDFWMMDLFNGCCVYDESTRWRSTRGHVLSFLLAGQDALLQCSHNQEPEEIVENLIDSLPDFMRHDAREHLVDAQVDQWVGSVNAQPGGWPVEELRGEHWPEPKEHPGLFLVGDYFFDSTLNAALISAHTAVELLLEHLHIDSAPVSKAIEALQSNGAQLSLGRR